MPLEDLLDVEVTLLKNSGQEWHRTPAAVHVVHASDARASGYLSVMESLREVPGMHVSQVSARTWAISARFYNSVYANKQQVLVDGVEAYSPVFSGVHWDLVDLPLEILERVEVVRGPGATLWGSNAVNGVINILTEEAADLQGGQITLGAGNELDRYVSFRYGDQFDGGHYYVWANNRAMDSNFLPSYGNAYDGFERSIAGFRVDIGQLEGHKLTFSGRIQESDFSIFSDNPRQFPASISQDPVYRVGNSSGAQLLARYSTAEDLQLSWQLSLAYDLVDRNNAMGFEHFTDTASIDWRGQLDAGSRHKIELGFRLQNHSFESESTVLTDLSFAPSLPVVELVPELCFTKFDAYLQDEFVLIPEKLTLLSGAKLEDNYFTGFEFQPAARLAWTVSPSQFVWASVSNAVATPSLFQHNYRYTLSYMDFGTLEGSPTGIYNPISWQGKPGTLDVENLIAYEAGWRTLVTPGTLLDAAIFFNQYDDLILYNRKPTTATSSLSNDSSATVSGGEFTLTARILDDLTLRSSYSLSHVDYHGLHSLDNSGRDMEQRFHLEAYLDLTEDLDLRTFFQYCDEIPLYDIESQWRMDATITWKANEQLDFALVGRNLFDPSHPEGKNPLVSNRLVEIERSIFLIATFQF